MTPERKQGENEDVFLSGLERAGKAFLICISPALEYALLLVSAIEFIRREMQAFGMGICCSPRTELFIKRIFILGLLGKVSHAGDFQELACGQLNLIKLVVVGVVFYSSEGSGVNKREIAEGQVVGREVVCVFFGVFAQKPEAVAQSAAGFHKFLFAFVVCSQFFPVYCLVHYLLGADELPGPDKSSLV